MAATNYTPIQLYYSTTASAAPTAGNLVNGELAINITDGKLYYKDNGGVVQVIATKGAGTIGGSNTQIQFNDGGALAGNAAMTFNKSTNVTSLTTLNLTNALGATYGGTAQSAYAQGDILYASAVNTLSKLTIGTVNYILTSTGSVPQWVAPSSVTVQTANNLAGGAAGSVPYQSAPDTTTFLSIGAANRVMTSTGSAPQWVTSLTGLTGVSSSSITNTSLTSGRLVYSTTGGAQTDSANLTFNGTTLSAGGFSTTGNSTLVKLVTIGDSAFTTGAVLGAATPAKLYIGTGAVTDGTSAGGATNTLGTITAFGQTQVIATNANVTYTNLATLYIAGAPTAGTNVTITNPYSLYVAGGASYLGGATTFNSTTQFNGVATHSANVLFSADNTYDLGASGATRPRTGYFGTSVVAPTFVMSGLTSGRVVYTTTSGQLTDSANLLYSGTDLTVYGITVGRGAGAVATNTAVGASALASNTTGSANVVVGYQAGDSVTGGYSNVFVGYRAGQSVTAAFHNIFIGADAGYNATANYGIGIGFEALYNNAATATGNIAAGYQSGKQNTTGAVTAFGTAALRENTTGYNSAFGNSALQNNTTGTYNDGFGDGAMFSNTTGSNNTASGFNALFSNTTASNNTAVGYQAGYSNTTGTQVTAVGYQAAYNGNADRTVAVGYQALYTNTGDRNTALGWTAMAANTSGAYNVGLGHEALRNNTVASNAVAVGYNALRLNTTGESNSGVGAYALTANTTGAYNVAVGNSALISNTTASYNTAVGHTAAYSNTTGAQNTAVGQEALYYNTTGSYNTALGRDALVNNTTANNNTAVGFQAGYNNTTGINNTYLGFQAGYTRSTSNYGVFVGGRAGFTSNGDGNTAVGNDAGYQLSSGTGNTLIGRSAGELLTTGSYNTFVGSTSGGGSFVGALITTGSRNTILGAYNGNQGGLDIRTGSNYVVLSDGDGNCPIFTGNGLNIALQGAGGPSAGTGIQFPATQNASTNANTLDDYEEGTWTCTMVGSGGGSVSLGTSYYVKVGQIVYCYFDSFGVSTSGLSGNISFQGLPFTSYASVSQSSYMFPTGANNTPCLFYVEQGQTNVTLYKAASGSSSVSNFTVSDFVTSTPSMRHSFVYRTNS